MRKFGIGRLLLVLVVTVFTSACSKSYVDPGFNKVSYSDLATEATVAEWQIEVEFQRNGKVLPAVHQELLVAVNRVINASRVVVPTTDKTAPKLTVMVNNIADLDEAFAKGFGTGLTFGAAGSQVTDYYEMKVTLEGQSVSFQQDDYKHAIHTILGSGRLPEGVQQLPLPAAFQVVVEQMLLTALKDIELQRQGASGTTPTS